MNRRAFFQALAALAGGAAIAPKLLAAKAPDALLRAYMQPAVGSIAEELLNVFEFHLDMRNHVGRNFDPVTFQYVSFETYRTITADMQVAGDPGLVGGELVHLRITDGVWEWGINGVIEAQVTGPLATGENPARVMQDILGRSGWPDPDIDHDSFERMAAELDRPVTLLRFQMVDSEGFVPERRFRIEIPIGDRNISPLPGGDATEFQNRRGVRPPIRFGD